MYHGPSFRDSFLEHRDPDMTLCAGSKNMRKRDL